MMKRLWLAALCAAVLSVIAAPAAWSADPKHLRMGTYENSNPPTGIRINNGDVTVASGKEADSKTPYETTFYYLAGMEAHVDNVAIGLRAANCGDGSSFSTTDVWHAEANGVVLDVKDKNVKDGGAYDLKQGNGFVITLPRSVLGSLEGNTEVTLAQRNANSTTNVVSRKLLVKPQKITFNSSAAGFSDTGEQIEVNFYKKSDKNKFDMQIFGFDLAGLKEDPMTGINIGLMAGDAIETGKEDLAGQVVNESGAEGIKITYDPVAKKLELAAKDGANGFGPAGKLTLAVYSTIPLQMAAPSGTGTQPATVAGVPESGAGKFIFKKIKITVHPAEDVPPSEEFGGDDGKIEKAIDKAIEEIDRDPGSERAKELEEMLDRLISDDKTPNYIVFGGGDDGESTFEFVNGYPDYFQRGIDIRDPAKVDTEFTFLVLKPGRPLTVNTDFAGPIEVKIWFDRELPAGAQGSWLMKDPYKVPFDNGVGKFTFDAQELADIVKERYPDYFETHDSFSGTVDLFCDVWEATSDGQPAGQRRFPFTVRDSSIQIYRGGGGSCTAGAGAAAIVLAAAALIWRRKHSK